MADRIRWAVQQRLRSRRAVRAGAVGRPAMMLAPTAALILLLAASGGGMASPTTLLPLPTVLTNLKTDDATTQSRLEGPLLFVDTGAALMARSPQLKLTVHPPIPGPRVLTPTSPWESWAVFSSNSVVQTRPGDANYSASTAVRMYYDCVSRNTTLHKGLNPANGLYSEIGWEKACVAISRDGLTWYKPKLNLIPFHGQPSNVVANCTGPSVFIDKAPGVPDRQRWKMICSNTVWAGPDGWHFEPMFGASNKSIHHMDDTQDVGYYDETSGRYVIYVRRDIHATLANSGRSRSAGVIRWVGRCETDDLSNWEKYSHNGAQGGCPVVLGPDVQDPNNVDVYTNSWTKYAGIDWFFPSFFHHFKSCMPWKGDVPGLPHVPGLAPNGFCNDGVLNIRLLYNLDTSRWVNHSTSQLKYVDTANGRSPFVGFGLNTCGPHATSPTVRGGWCGSKNGELEKTSSSTSGGYMVVGAVESLDGTEVYLYASAQPFTHGSALGRQTWGNNTGIYILRSRKHGFVSLDAPYAFDFQSRAEMPHFVTRSLLVPCGRNVALLFNVRTSNVGYLVVELRGADGRAINGFHLNDSVPIRGNSLAAAASWYTGNISNCQCTSSGSGCNTKDCNHTSSLDSLEGSRISVMVAMVDAELYSLEVTPQVDVAVVGADAERADAIDDDHVHEKLGQYKALLASRDAELARKDAEIAALRQRLANAPVSPCT
eukprot:COSAG05_NODE_736_length_7639_cov_70.224005_5_plen_712_part_00